LKQNQGWWSSSRRGNRTRSWWSRRSGKGTTEAAEVEDEVPKWEKEDTEVEEAAKETEANEDTAKVKGMTNKVEAEVVKVVIEGEEDELNGWLVLSGWLADGLISMIRVMTVVVMNYNIYQIIVKLVICTLR
jgi:hypothetical protein